MHHRVNKSEFESRQRFYRCGKLQGNVNDVEIASEDDLMWVRSVHGCGNVSSPYLDLGFDLPSDPDASLPLLLEAKNDGLSLPSDGLGCRLLPVRDES